MVEGLEAQVARRTKWLWATIAAIVLVGALTVGAGFYLIERNNRRQAAEQTRQGQALCSTWKVTAETDLLTTSTAVARSFVRTSVDAYRLTQCERLSGPLGEVDPEAYRPAPAPAR